MTTYWPAGCVWLILLVRSIMYEYILLECFISSIFDKNEQVHKHEFLTFVVLLKHLQMILASHYNKLPMKMQTDIQQKYYILILNNFCHCCYLALVLLLWQCWIWCKAILIYFTLSTFGTTLWCAKKMPSSPATNNIPCH